MKYPKERHRTLWHQIYKYPDKCMIDCIYAGDDVQNCCCFKKNLAIDHHFFRTKIKCKAIPLRKECSLPTNQLGTTTREIWCNSYDVWLRTANKKSRCEEGWWPQHTPTLCLVPPTSYEHRIWKNRVSMGFQVRFKHVLFHGDFGWLQVPWPKWPLDPKQREQRAREGAVVPKDLAG